MAELFVGPIMGKIIDTCFEYLQDHLSWRTDLKELEKRLRQNHLTIQAIVSIASQLDIKDPLNKWIWQLRDAIDEADDLLDEFVYMEHDKWLAKNKETTKVSSPLNFLEESFSEVCEVSKGFLKTDSNLKRLEEVVQKLDEISAEVSNFLYLLKDTKQVQQLQEHELLKAREEGSFPKSILIGREKDKEYVMQWLRKPDETDITTNKLYSNISLLSIVGHGGMGKTSLLQHVYQDEMTKDFDPKIWVCVSNHFDIKKLIADMLESSKEDRPSLDNISALQERLQSKVMSKKFLLVLDDIWKEGDINKWETVLAPLAHGSFGSKILITTRMDSVAKMISEVTENKMEKLILEGLEEEKCLQLLKRHAFANVKNQGEYKKLELIAGGLVKKLYGSPLAAKVIGGVLNKNLDERHWTNVSKNSALGRNEILSILKLSYTFLPKELQNCFTFCSIFPQDHLFYKDDLVRMWIAVGFIQPSDIQGGEDLEDVGQRYFDLLVQKSFFDPYHSYYKMHDLLHDVARSISAQECLRFEGDQKLFTRVPETIRHLSVDTNNVEVLRNLGKFKNLRTLWITYEENNQDFDDVLTAIFKETRSIRLLNIDHYCLKPIPKTIGYLMHLRYLRLNFDDLTLFSIPPRTLYHLQYIIHNGFLSTSNLLDDFFPREMSNLSNLRHTSLNWFNFPGIGKLKFLQELREFCVKKEIKIGELEHMNDLRILKIYCLENVRDAEEACNAKLRDKRKLTNLSLNWGKEHNQFARPDDRGMRINIADPDLDERPERVLDNLRPHHDLKVLKIFDYMGVRSAIWMNKTDSIKNLEEIEIKRCLEWQNLPPFGQLLFLKSLSLFRMPKADWFDGGVKAEDGCLFPYLTELTLDDCPNLQVLPYLPPKLKTLDIRNIGWKTLNCCSISKSIPLETLKIRNCPKLTYIFLACETDRLAALVTVEIEDCPNLIYFGELEEVETIGNIPASLESLQCLVSSLSTISSLQHLTLIRIPLLKSLTDLPPSLKSLRLNNLDNLDCLPSCLPTLSFLTELNISEVPKLRELPDLPPSLCKLYLQNLDNLDCLPSCLPTLPSLKFLDINKVPKLRELPDLPPSLWKLYLKNLDNLSCLPSCLSTLSSLRSLSIIEVPKLRELPHLPPSLISENVRLGG